MRIIFCCAVNKFYFHRKNSDDIEKQISQNLNLFLYELAVKKLANEDIKIKEHNDK